MATTMHIPLSEYLETSYRPDREYVDGEIRERNVGKWEHARIQAALTGWFWPHQADWNIMVATELRTQVSFNRVRIPDLVLVATGSRVPEVLVEPLLLVVEILSPDDTDSDTEERAADYLAMGGQDGLDHRS